MNGVYAPLDGLSVVVLLEVPGDVAVVVRDAGPLELRQRVHVFLRAHIRPQHSAALLHRIRLELNLLLEVAVEGLGRHVHAGAIDVVLPAVVRAAQAVLLVATEEEVGVAVSAQPVDQSHLSRCVPERHETLPKQFDANGIAVRAGDVLR